VCMLIVSCVFSGFASSLFLRHPFNYLLFMILICTKDKFWESVIAIRWLAILFYSYPFMCVKVVFLIFVLFCQVVVLTSFHK
jgi:hypothetical protein